MERSKRTLSRADPPGASPGVGTSENVSSGCKCFLGALVTFAGHGERNEAIDHPRIQFCSRLLFSLVALLILTYLAELRCTFSGGIKGALYE